MKTTLIKTTLVAAVVAGLGSVPGFAADLPQRLRTKAPVVAPVYDWTGFYIGGHVGGGWGQSDWTFQNESFFNDDPGDHLNFNPSGWLGGGHVGFNYQINRLVIGIEGTWSAADIKHTVTSPFFPASDRETTRITSLYTVAGRVGTAWDQFLIYGKGGLAGGQVEPSAVATVATIEGFEGGQFFWKPGKSHRSGWVIGAGVEYMLVSNVMIGVEYNHIDLGTANYTARDNSPESLIASVDDRTRIDSVVGRISYKFGAPAGARY